MDTNRLKRFATEARNILMQGVAHRFTALGFLPDGNVTEEPQPMGGGATFMGDTVSEDFYKKWCSLQQAVKRHSIEEVAEEAAYTWFNRLMAIRIMVKNGLIAPVLQYESEGVHIPLLVSEARQGRMPDMNADDQRKLEDLLLDDSKTDEQFRILIVAFCHANPVINSCFGHISDYTELLLPTNILAEGGFVDMLNNTEFIGEEDYHSPELIGWLYQFYISEKKDDVFASFKKGKKAEAKDIPAATQIFTPNWIVKYMVQNTIGRIYLDNNPYEEDIQKGWKYLVNQELENSRIGNGEKFSNSQILDNILRLDDLKELKFADLACGSGHILNEGFDMLFDLYVLEGYSRSQAIENIFRYNLTGVDIDTRAKQLAQFALLLKACQKDSSFADAHIMPRVLDMPEPYDPEAISMSLESACLKFIGGYEDVVAEDLAACFEIMYDADTLGCIMDLEMDEEFLIMVKHYYEEWTEGGTDDCPDYIKALLPGVELILALNEKYAALVMNPPYMGSGNMNKVLSDYVKDNYPEGKADLCTAFMMMQARRTARGGYYANIVPPSWMFLSTFEGLRRSIIEDQTISSLLHLSRGVFGADFGSVSTVIQNCETKNAKGTYFRLIERTFQEFDQKHLKMLFEKTLANHDFKFFFADYTKDVTDIEYSENGAKIYYPNVGQENFEKIPGNVIGYWLSPTMLSLFENSKPLSSEARAVAGIQTGDNERFVRLWHEVSKQKLITQDYTFDKKWYPYNKGGSFRKWYGNQELVVNWENNGKELKSFKRATLRNPTLYFRPSISWSLTSSVACGFRYNPNAALFDINGMSLFPIGNRSHYFYLSALNTKVYQRINNIINPTLATQCGDVSRFPAPKHGANENQVIRLGKENVYISRHDWDSHETSWDFEANPLVAMVGGAASLPHNNGHEATGGAAFLPHNNGVNDPSDAGSVRQECRTSYRLEDLVKAFEAEWTERFMQLHQNEEELNRQFIEIYGLQDELTPDVPLSEITILQQGEITIENE